MPGVPSCWVCVLCTLITALWLGTRGVAGDPWGGWGPVGWLVHRTLGRVNEGPRCAQLWCRWWKVAADTRSEQ